ncbi:MAG TPA: lipopolysaccharide heptosyltransferase II [Candidatus Omnitrophota bacterium]|nr:lipopolysaccharide heptosyltransferase II [Candidatus Omnitrophota bacterium]HPS19834.1 lipopolysaccharide heptosyltransferase II [Candidatus Omnitrophota bacterium]
MNVLQLLPKLELGGVERGTIEMSRYLTMKGHKAVVVSGGGRLEKSLTAAGAKHYMLPVGKKNPLIMVYCYFKIRAIIKKENIHLVHGRSRVPALIGYFAARAEKRTFITTAHGHYKKHLISKVMGWGKIVIVASNFMAQYMKENFGVLPGKIVVIPRGVDLERFSFIRPAKRADKVFRVGMIARFTPLKGHMDFLKAVAYVSRKMPNLEVVLMGDRNEARPDYIKKMDLAIKRYLIDKIVRFVGPGESVPEVLRGLDVLVSASREQEAFGRSIIEAQARGVPVVATRVGGVVETVEDGVTGLLCEASDPSDMANKIMKYASSLEFRQEIAEKARKNVEELYSVERCMSLELEAYRRACEIKKILVFKISSLGDVILSVPSLRAIRSRFADASIKVLVDVKFRKVLEGCPYVDEIITCDFNERDAGAGFFKLADRLRAEDFDFSVDLQNSTKSHLLAFLGMIPERFGYNNGKMSFLLNHKAVLPKKAMGPVDHQAQLLSILGINMVEKSLELWPGEEHKKWAKNFLQVNWLNEGQKLVGISLSASARWGTKNWGMSQIQSLADMLGKDDIRVVFIGTPSDIPAAEKLTKKNNLKAINAVGKTNISQLIALIAECSVVVSGDSSPMHIAAGVGVPFVGLFGPTDPDRHAPPAVKCRIIGKKAKCSPCYKGECNNGHRCMSGIRPQEVYNAVKDLM